MEKRRNPRMNLLLFFVVFSAVHGVLDVEALTCQRCMGATSPLDCHSSTCAAGERCYVEETVTALQEVRYNLGCESLQVCQSLTVAPFGRRHLASRDPRQVPSVTTCFRCCDSDLCNRGNCSVLDRCASSPCSNGGTCENTDTGFLCHCPSGFTGNTCSQDVDECLGHPCQNGGTCVNTAGSFTCTCPLRYVGARCDRRSNGTVCQSCLGVSSPLACSNPVVCSDNEECYTDRLLSGGGTSYNMGCRSTGFCDFFKQHVQVGRETRQSHVITTCSDCCRHDDCNRDVCREATTGTICMSCDNVDSPDDCHKVTVCDVTQECYGARNLDMVTGRTTFNLGCAAKQVCTSKTAVGRRDVTMCVQCCSHHYCNKELCTGASVSTSTTVTTTTTVSTTTTATTTSTAPTTPSSSIAPTRDHLDFPRYYSKQPESPVKMPCEDHTSDCIHLTALGICSDQWGLRLCPRTCNICYENFCYGFPCQNNGSCSYVEGLIGQVTPGYRCRCTVAFEGKNCTDQVDMCGNYSPCKNGATCSNVFGGYTCTCPSLLYTGVNCSETVDVCGQDKDKCKNGGSCSNDPNQADGFVCSCAGFYTGKTCEKPEDVCGQDGKCENGGTCVNSPASTNGFTCQCSAHFTGQTCGQQVDPCSPNPCANNATCRKNGTNGFVCDCGLAFTGSLCEKEKGACERFPFSPCQNQGTCINDGDTYRCTCPQGYTGSRCESKLSVCDSHPCQHGGHCISNGDTYTCMCTDKYKGDNCEEIRGLCDTLPFSPCQHGGTCVNTADGLLVCQCPPGISGSTCSIVTTTTPQTTPTTTADPCLSLVCQHGGSCVVTGGTAKCACVGEYTGDHCEVDPCLFAFCQNSAPCLVSSEGKAQCQCPGGFSGPYCQHSLCDSSPCHNGGSCHVNNGAVTCHCPGNFTGQHCETQKKFVDITALGCEGKQDIVVLVGHGPHTSDTEFRSELHFVERLVQDKRMHLGPDGTHLALMTYGTDVTPVLNFTGDVSAAVNSLEAFINKTVILQPHVDLPRALDKARETLLSSHTGARSDASKVVLVILEETEASRQVLVQAASRLRDNWISLNIVPVYNADWLLPRSALQILGGRVQGRFLLPKTSFNSQNKSTQAPTVSHHQPTTEPPVAFQTPEPFVAPPAAPFRRTPYDQDAIEAALNLFPGGFDAHCHHFLNVFGLDHPQGVDIFESSAKCSRAH